MNHAEIIAAAAAEARRQGFTLAAIHAIPALRAAMVLCIAPREVPWAVHRISGNSSALDEGEYFSTRETALFQFNERLIYQLCWAAAA